MIDNWRWRWTPVRSMAEQSLWEVEVPAAMEELGLVCAAQEQYHALAAAPVVSSPSMRWRAWRGRRRWRKGVANNGYFYLFLKYEILPPSWHSAWAFNHLEHKMQIDLWIKKLESDRCFPRQPSPSSRSSLSTSGSSRSFLKTQAIFRSAFPVKSSAFCCDESNAYFAILWIV